jgi:hypothetical protein
LWVRWQGCLFLLRFFCFWTQWRILRYVRSFCLYLLGFILVLNFS